MRACGALAGAQRARVAPRRPRGHDGLRRLVPLLQGGSDQDYEETDRLEMLLLGQDVLSDFLPGT